SILRSASIAESKACCRAGSAGESLAPAAARSLGGWPGRSMAWVYIGGSPVRRAARYAKAVGSRRAGSLFPGLYIPTGRSVNKQGASLENHRSARARAAEPARPALRLLPGLGRPPLGDPGRGRDGQRPDRLGRGLRARARA